VRFFSLHGSCPGGKPTQGGASCIGGTLPAGLGAAAALETLDLEHNEISGSVPTQLGGLGNLQILKLNGNDLSGDLPGGLPACEHCVCDVSDNCFDTTRVRACSAIDGQHSCDGPGPGPGPGPTDPPTPTPTPTPTGTPTPTPTPTETPTAMPMEKPKAAPIERR